MPERPFIDLLPFKQSHRVALWIGELRKSQRIEPVDIHRIGYFHTRAAQPINMPVQLGRSDSDDRFSYVISTVEHLKEHGSSQFPFMAGWLGFIIPCAFEQLHIPPRKAFKVPRIYAYEYVFDLHRISLSRYPV